MFWTIALEDGYLFGLMTFEDVYFYRLMKFR